MTVTIDALVVADQPEAWQAAGFAVGDDGRCRIGSVAVRLVGGEQGKGVIGWSLRGIPADRTDVDGVPTTLSTAPPPSAEPPLHPNGTTHVDHVVLLSPDLDRTTTALADLGLEARRERDGELWGAPMRQVFYRLGDVILELVGAPGVAGEGPATLWGVTYAVADIDATAELLGERTSRVKDAVQPGRRITTLRHRELGMSVRTAFISPHVRA
ncbi:MULTISPECIES: VOC family protein [unclassified Nocardioides]|uniref:VOC family protein n=1 Tax=unclassified Nocardioides TaxID=2615069 RepID=UPI000702FA21|nr:MULTISPECIES: VOC family protein [unclassified Nocardioides]KRC55042.1 glyoxalase [Nocardioides sp. Root79]KRC72038.1 glyoxalase [Nocardioides sp. Root240]